MKYRIQLDLVDCASAGTIFEGTMTEEYLAIIPLIERLHRHFLNVMKLELDSFDIRDTNNVQAMILFNIGDAEMTVGELTLRGCHLGSNVSYNLKKMVESGYVEQARSTYDRRSTHVRLTDAFMMPPFSIAWCVVGEHEVE